jgi:hypothetical protein
MLTAVYDLAVSPPTFDCVGFLAAADRYRIQLGDEQFKVAIVPGPDHGFRADCLPPRAPEKRMTMRRQIVEAACGLLPACIGVDIVQRAALRLTGPVFPLAYHPGNPEAHYGAGRILESCRAKHFPFRAEPAPLAPRTVTMTLRESHYWPQRNSNRYAWLAAGDRLIDLGYQVIIIPDVDSAPLPGRFGIADFATTDLRARAELYAGAAANLFINNGPAWLATLMDRVPVTIFKMLAEGAPACSAPFFAGHGLHVGAQIGRPGHRIAWEDDTADAIVRSFEERAAA